MGYKILLPNVPEPIEWKKYWKKELEINRKITEITIKQGTWFAKDFWRKYKEVLKRQGVKWQDIMEAYGVCKYYFLKWAEGEMKWKEVIKRFEEALNLIVSIKARK